MNFSSCAAELFLNDCAFIGNFANEGGADMRLFAGAIAVLEDCSFRYGTVAPADQATRLKSGGSVRIMSSTFNCTRCDFSNSSVTDGYGAAIIVEGGSANFVLSRFSNFTNPSAYGDAHIIHDSVGEGFPITLDRCFFDDSNQIPALSASAGDGAVLVQNTVGLEAEDVEHVNIVASCAMTDAFCDADFCTDIALGTSCTCADAGSDRIVDASDCRSMARMEFAVPRSLNFDLLLSKPARGYAELVLSNSGGAELSWALGSAEMSDRHAFAWRVSPDKGELPSGGIAVLGFTLNTTGAISRMEPYELSVPFVSDSMCACYAKTVDVSAVISLSAPVDANLSVVALDVSRKLVAGSELKVEVWPRDAEALPVLDAANSAFVATLTHLRTASSVVAALSYHPRENHTHGTSMRLPVVADEPLIGACELNVTLQGELVDSLPFIVALCPADYYGDAESCVPCPDGARCNAPGTTPETMGVEPDYWLPDCANCVKPLRCPMPDVCLGKTVGANASNSGCRDGHEGAYCTVCEAEHYSAADGCEPCAEGGYLPTLVVAILVLVAVALMLYRFCAGGGGRSSGGKAAVHVASPAPRDGGSAPRPSLPRQDSERIAEQNRRLAKQASGAQKKFASYASMATAFWQMVTNIAPIYNIRWPGSFANFMRVLGGIISFDVFTLLPIDCIGRTNHHSGLLLYVAGTAAVTSFALGYIAHLHYVKGNRAEAKKEVATRGLLVFFNFFYMPVATDAFQTYPCEEFEDGTEMLIADYSIDCNSDEHAEYAALAGVTTGMFVIGLPVVSLELLRRGKLAKDNGTTKGSLVTTFDALSDAFRPEAYWMQPLLNLQKVTVSGVLVFFDPSLTQSLAGLGVAIFWALVLTWLRPFPTTGENVCQAVLNGALCAIMLGAVASSLVDLQAIVDEYTTVVGDFIEPAFSEWLLWVSAMAAIAIFPLVIGVEWKYGDWRKEPTAAKEGAAAAAEEEEAEAEEEEEDDRQGEPEQKTGEQEVTEDFVVELARGTPNAPAATVPEKPQ